MRSDAISCGRAASRYACSWVGSFADFSFYQKGDWSEPSPPAPLPERERGEDPHPQPSPSERGE